jgi:RNA polymerase sigma factor for flagellar operon FliA
VGDPVSAGAAEERQALEARFLAQLDWIERAARSIARRHGLSQDEADDFTGWARLKLVEEDYAVLAKFRGESSITTYLTVVIAMLWRDYRVRQWGRWRPSAAARRKGQLAVRLETLLRRDGLRLSEAAERLRTAGETDLSDRELARLSAELPLRAPVRVVRLAGDASEPSAAGGADDYAAEDESADQTKAVGKALESLAAEDRLVLRLRFWEGLSVADVARGLGVPQKPLYRRIERLLAQLRKLLVQNGLSRDDVRAAIGGWSS